jgi:hypothetical protein
MEKQEAIEMLQSLIANIENDHVSIVETKGETGGSLSWLTLILSGSPQIMRVNQQYNGLSDVKTGQVLVIGESDKSAIE